MEFLSPLFLAGLAAVAVPLAIHLIRREKPPKILFGSIRFLQKTSKRLVLFQHLRQWLLLLLRAGIIALLALAFARPLLVNQDLPQLPGTDMQSTVLLLDLSLSMNYDGVFADARRRALELIDGMTPGDEAALVVFAGSARILHELSGDLAGLRRTVAALDGPNALDAGDDGDDDAGAVVDAVSHATTDYLSALGLADSLLESARYQRRAVFMVSDFQANGFDRDGAADFMLAPGIAFNGIDVGVEESVNLAITDLRAPAYLLAQTEDEQTLLARLRSTGTVLQQQGEVSLLVDGEVVARQSVELNDRSEAVLSFNAAFPAEGSYQGELRLEDDDGFAADDVYRFNVEVLPKMRVLAVNGEAAADWFDDEGHWFRLAVAGNPDSPFLLQTVAPADLDAAALRGHDALVLLNVGGLDARQAAAIIDYVQGGGGLLLAPGDQVEAEPFNRLFAAITPARLDAPELLPRDDYLVIGDYDRRHPVMAPLGTDWAARFRARWRVVSSTDVSSAADDSSAVADAFSAAAGVEVLMRFDDTEPALLARQVGNGRVMLFASPLDLEWNNLALQGLYLPFIHQTLHYLARPETVASNNDGTFRADGSFPGADGSFPGADGSAAPPRESEFTRIPVSTLHDAVINPDTTPQQSPQVQQALMLQDIERPQSLWWYLLSLCLLLAIAETHLANRTYR